jgi:hypothetical protein
MNEHMKLNVPEDWQPFDEVYRDFVEANPMLGLNASEFASTRLRQQYGERLLAAGAATRLPNRRWLASPRRFGPALFAAMTARRAEILGRGGRSSDEDDGQ